MSWVATASYSTAARRVLFDSAPHSAATSTRRDPRASDATGRQNPHRMPRAHITAQPLHRLAVRQACAPSVTCDHRAGTAGRRGRRPARRRTTRHPNNLAGDLGQEPIHRAHQSPAQAHASDSSRSGFSVPCMPPILPTPTDPSTPTRITQLLELTSSWTASTEQAAEPRFSARQVWRRTASGSTAMERSRQPSEAAGWAIGTTPEVHGRDRIPAVCWR